MTGEQDLSDSKYDSSLKCVQKSVENDLKSKTKHLSKSLIKVRQKDQIIPVNRAFTQREPSMNLASLRSQIPIGQTEWSIQSTWQPQYFPQLQCPEGDESSPTGQGATQAQTCRMQFITCHRGLQSAYFKTRGIAGKTEFPPLQEANFSWKMETE